jgi:hypothetical protein
MAGIDSQVSRAGDRGGEGRLAGMSRSDEIARARTRSVGLSLASTPVSNGDDAGGVGNLCPRDACALEATRRSSVTLGPPFLVVSPTSAPTSMPKGDSDCIVFHHTSCS